ncbi:hypothetical protein PG993_008673 [Apiospora rasikravindrae]|uniref:START domain-containing protein n=1 Tax=Apiospora rasikravindrae TaxID=990691 RepID=A0ABR1SQT3_9PEZI
MLLLAFTWAITAPIWFTHGVQSHPTAAAPARRDGSADVDWGSIRCPAANSPETFPTPSYRTEKGLFLVCTEQVINATPQDVYHALLDFQAYSAWNSFVRYVALPADVVKTPDDVYVGLVTRFTTAGILPLVNTTSVEIVTVTKGSFDDGSSPGEGEPAPGTTAGRYLMAAWRYDDGLHGAAERSEHPNILVDRGDGTTLYISYETFFVGPGALLLLPLKDTLQKLYTQQGLDLKAYIEKGV